MTWDITNEQNSPQNLKFLAARLKSFSNCNFWIAVSFCIVCFFSVSGFLMPADWKELASIVAILTLLYSIFEVAYIDPLVNKCASQNAGFAEEFDCRVFDIERNQNFLSEVSDNTIGTLASSLKPKSWEGLQNWYSTRLGELPRPVAALVAQYSSTAYDQGLRRFYLRILWTAITVLSVSIISYIIYEDNKFRSSIVTFAIPFLPILVWLIKAIVSNRSIVTNQENSLLTMEKQWAQVLARHLDDGALLGIVRDNQDALYLRRTNGSLVFPKLYALYRPKLESMASKNAADFAADYLKPT